MEGHALQNPLARPYSGDAETVFKLTVRYLVQEGIYPAAKACFRYLGYDHWWHRDSLNGRQCRWREEVLEELGWTYVGVHVRKGRWSARSWDPPVGWKEGEGCR